MGGKKMKLKKTTQSREDYLKGLSKDEYRTVLNNLISYNFLRRVNSYRMEFDTQEEFVDEFFWMIFNYSMLSPIPQITIAYEEALNEKPKDRWKHFSERDWDCYVDIYNLWDGKTIKDIDIKKMKKYYDKYFYKEFMMDYKEEGNE